MIDYEVEYSHTEDCVFVNFWDGDCLVEQYVMPKNVTVADLKEAIARAVEQLQQAAPVLQ